MDLFGMLHRILGRDKEMEKINHRGMCLNCCRHINDILVCLVLFVFARIYTKEGDKEEREAILVYTEYYSEKF